MLTPGLFSTDSESVRDSGISHGPQQVPRRVIDLGDGFPLEFASVLAEGNRRRGPDRAGVVPRRVECQKDEGVHELLVPGPLPVPTPGASDGAFIILFKKIPVREKGL